MSESRIAFVTGGGGGIGAAICRALAKAGQRVAAADLAVAAAQAVAKEIDGLSIELDVTRPDSVTGAVSRAERELGPIDICVNCAGWDNFKPFLDSDEAFTARVLEINLAGPIRVMRAVLPGMVERRWGRVINIASDAGRVGSMQESVYSGAKGGLIAITKTVAREVAGYGITANSICPGLTDTPMLDVIKAANPKAERVLDAVGRAIPMRRLGRPEDIAPAVAFLASEEAGFITGQTLSVSGGLTMA
jgi:2-hydroxycyclohexanecarboxyl-CoA dehydrogenase